MSNSPNKTNKLVRFLRNNAALLLIIFCVIAIGTVVLVATLSPVPPIDEPVNNDPKPDPKDPVYETVRVYFESPLDFSSTGQQFTDAEILFVYNSTLNKWAKHYAIDYIAASGTGVAAMYDGTVISINDSYGWATSVEIDHGNGIIATYKSLQDVVVVVGQVVEKGEQIGIVSACNYEYDQGPHLHLEVVVNNVKTNPTAYVNGDVYFEFQVLVEE